jgi:hypothetical protein
MQQRGHASWRGNACAQAAGNAVPAQYNLAEPLPQRLQELLAALDAITDAPLTSGRRSEMAVERRHPPRSRNAAFTPETGAMITAAYEAVLNKLDLADQYDPVTLLISRRIFDLAEEGERDVQRLVAVSLSNAFAYRRLNDRVS